ncbi:ABC transporter substrate-binding protein [Paenibacillus hemerocallicola]|uniref:ABC transporter substrate-binding protein n=1 Tax=Paenibacillus hemerocallicola TaxID=1172614 RepID=A0A5C4TD69_9BACL|nr:ABC transporter substrate-binding protein [Paenibacillus hemerocallicola]TNJ66457.1 ABC transporter substrate-binding protein [Paenibacillus hemerocallicola]
MFRSRHGWPPIAALIVLCFVLLAGCGGGMTNNNAGTASPASPAPPASPQPAKSGAPKIAVTYFPYAEHLFAIGQAGAVKGVVGLSSLKQFSVYDPFLRDGAIVDLGDEANLEKIIALNPDLIIASQFDEKIAEQLSKIAKTVTINTTLNWQETIVQVAAVVGEEAKAKQYIDGFNKKGSEIAALMEQSGQKGKTALFIMPWKKGFTYWSGSRMALYYDKLGFKPFDGMKNTGEITLEGIAELNPEYIFIGKDYTNSSEITLKDLETNPVWQGLNAVKNKKMFVVDTEILGPLAMGQSKGLDYVEKLMKAGK